VSSRNSDKLTISVVITTYNRRHSLERCLEALANQSFPPSEYEIIVVADGCTDDTEDLLRSFRPACAFRWISQANLGQASAMNAGVAAANGEIVLFLDDDIVCSPGLVAAHRQSHAREWGPRRAFCWRAGVNEGAVVLGPVVLHPDAPPGALRDLIGAFAAAEFRRLSSQGPRPGDLMLCANSSIERQAALRFSFDSSFKRLHDVDAGLRLLADGYRPLFAPGAIAYELYAKSVDAFLRDSALLGKYEVMLSRRYPEFRAWAGTGRIHQGNPIKRALRRQLAIHASASESALQAVFSLANPLRVLPPMNWLARRVLKARAGIAHLKGAMEEAGSWEKLEDEFSVQRNESAASSAAR